jgi:hypothetical protein
VGLRWPKGYPEFAMNPELKLTEIRDEVCRKIGRNLLNIQKIELMLKHLIAIGRVSGYASELAENHKQRAEQVHNQTMGNLVNQFLDNAFSRSEEPAQSTDELKEPHISFSFAIEADADFYESKKQALKTLVDERNDLAHHLLTRFNIESIDGCLQLEQFLDQQREKHIAEYDFLKLLIDDIKEMRQSQNDFINSEEGIRQIELWCLQQSPVVALLLDISSRHGYGWTLLSTAGQQIREVLPGKMEWLKEKAGYKTLKEFMLASELFEIIEERTEKGGTRVLYRPKLE